MFKFIKQIFVATPMFLISLSNLNQLQCVSMNHEECNVRPEVMKHVNVNVD